MTKYVCLDSETSGLFDFSKRAHEEGQPRMAQMAMVFLAADFTVERSVSMLVRPHGWTMPDEVAKIHGLTQARLEAEGVPVAQALDAFNAALDESRIVVAYNASYDLKVLRGELRRADLPDRFETTASIDCMRPLVNVCKLAKAKGGGYKFPKLTEAYRHCFGHDMTGAHGALEDATACARIFAWMVANKLFTEDQLTGVRPL